MDGSREVGREKFSLHTEERGFLADESHPLVFRSVSVLEVVF